MTLDQSFLAGLFGIAIGLLVTVNFLVLRMGDISENLRRIEMALVRAARGELTNKKCGLGDEAYPSNFHEIGSDAPKETESGSSLMEEC